MASRLHRDLTAELVDVRRSFDGRTVLRDVDLGVHRGEFVALLGASGSGKTTILRLISGLDQDASGTLTVPRNQAVVFQEHRLLPWAKVWRNVAVGLPRADRKQRALDALAEVGLTDRANAWPGTLSGGESQRVALARALVRQPDLLLLDEPFAALDALTRLTMQGLVGRLWAEHGFSVLLVTHDVTEAVLLADRALVLDGGRLAHEIPIDLPRPRRDDSLEFVHLRTRLLDLLGVEAHGAA